MITNKDIRVENGNLVLNGDKYPLDGQSPEAIMAIVEDNSDTTPTENSTAPITSGGVYNALEEIKSNFDWKFAGEFRADGNITLEHSLDNASEMMITLFFGLPRQTVLIDSISRLIQYDLFPDCMTYDGWRVYARIHYVDATHVTISQLTGLSAIGETAKFIIEIR